MKIKTLKIAVALFLILTFVSTGYPFQQTEIEEKTSVIDSSELKKEIQNTQFFLTQKELHILGNYDPGVWINHLPHLWLSQPAQPGQPQTYRALGFSSWMNEINWNGMQLVDPVYGIFDLNFLPRIQIDTLVSQDQHNFTPGSFFQGINIIDEKTIIPKPFTQVFYQNAETNLSNIDIQFRRGFTRQIRFKSGVNFFKNDGNYSNSKINNFTINSQIFIPISNTIYLKSGFLSNRIEAGYPGAIVTTSANQRLVQFTRLHRKVLRQDFYGILEFEKSTAWRGRVKVELHQDRREYTDWSKPWHTIEKLRWAELSGQIERKSVSSTTKAGITTEAVFASGLGFKKIEEFPLGINLFHQKDFFYDSEISINTGFTYFNRDWQGFFSGLELGKKLSQQINIKTSIFYQRRVPPMGWRAGRVMPFEYQPWTISINQADSTFISPSKPKKPVRVTGSRFRLNIKPSDKLIVYADLLFQQIAELTFPATAGTGQLEFFTNPDFRSFGLFINGKFLATDWLSLTGRYQYSNFSNRKSPDLAEIPDHWFFLQLYSSRYFFQKNLKANFVFNVENIGIRSSYELFSADSDYGPELLENILLINLKLIFEISSAEIFLHWQNLTDQSYSYRSQQPMPGLQFHFGVRWKFWD